MTLSREIAGTAAAWQRWRRRLRHGGGESEDPFEATRWVSGHTTFVGVTNGLAQDPLCIPLRRWVYRLAEQRINRPAISRAAEQRYIATHELEVPERIQASLSSVLERVLADSARRGAWLAALRARGAVLASAEGHLWERRQETAVRLGCRSPDEIELPCPDIYEDARAWLARTRDLHASLGVPNLEAWLESALATAVCEGWPARANERTMTALLGDGDLLRGIDLCVDGLPVALAPASFPLAMWRLGMAWVEGTAPRHQPFVVARDPYGLRDHEYGALFSLLFLSRAFLRKQLGVSRAAVRGYERALAASALAASRVLALRVLLRPEALQGLGTWRRRFEDRVADALGFGLSSELAGVLFRLEVDDGQRFAGLLLGASRAERLLVEYDEDWFRNPRAAESLRDEASLSPEWSATKEALEAGSAALAGLLEGLLG